MKQRRWPGLIRPSARALFHEAGRMPGFSLLDRLHAYVYIRWPYLYIGIGTGEHVLAKILGPPVRLVGKLFPPPPRPDRETGTFADGYHGKVVPLEAAAQLVTVQEDVTLTELEQAIPFTRARDIVLQNPDHIMALECPCRATRDNPCQPLDVCLIVGEPFASFVAEHHPRRSRWISQDEAVQILREEQERGHVSHAFFKDAMLGRFYAICNCCSCCCGAMQAQRNGTPMLISSGYVAQVNEALCASCGACVSYCQFGAISLNGRSAVSANACMGCGVCASKCPEGAITLVRDPAKGEPLEIQKLIAQAAQVVEG